MNFQMTIDDLEKEARRHNRRLAKKLVQWLIEHSTSYQLMCWVESLVLPNPLLRQVPKRYVKAFRIIATSK